MQQLYDVFYRNNGIRRIQGLISPKRIQLTNLPRNSLIHYLSETPGILDVDTSKPYLNGYSKQILIDYPTALTSTAGNPRLKSAMIQSLVRPFHKANRHYRYVKDHYKVTSDPSTLFIENYSYLEEFYRYAPNTMLAYNKWLNTYKTMWDKANEIATASDKHQFFFVKLPEVLPSYSLLKIYSAKVNLALTRIFDTPAKLMMLEIWKWLDVNYRSSSILSAVKSENLNKINLLLEVRDGTTVIINLGVLNSFIKEDISTEDATPNTQVQAIQLQKLFLKLMITLSGSITPEEELVVDSSQDVTNASSLVPDGVTTGKTENIDADEELDTEDDPADENVAFVGATAGDDKSMASGLKNDSDKALADIMNNGATLSSSLKDIDEDIDNLETITKKALKSSGITIDENGELLEEEEEVETPVEVLEAAVYGYVDPDDAVKVKVDELAEAGLLSASDYKRFMRDIEQAKQLKDPYGSGKLSSEVRTITPEDVALDKEKCTIVASELVQDKSMLQSSLNSFDADYINKVLKKDMLSMVHALQKSGVLVKKHEIEVVNSALGAYEAHTLELKPVDGMPSTIHFKLPVIDEDGTMCANGNKYKLRTQRVDRPIRKIAPSIVALTSYYGKTFVEAGAKKANNSVEWIIRQINKASIGEGEYISKVSPASLFNNRTVAPYIYNALSAHFKYIKAGIYHLHFNYGKRAELVSEDALHKLETGGKVVCGFSDKKEPIVVDEANNFFTYSKGIFTPLGNIFSVLKLPEVLSPVDFSEVRIFSKQIPVGIVLGYFIGFKNLVKLLKAKYRIVEARKNKALEPHEYAISFSDMSYVFDRRERRNSYILGGFTDYDKAIKPYPAKEFNSKHIYMNLLASKGLGSLFIREMELTEQLFVDPITKSILEEMGEPVTFNGLLIRASEMLLTYHHPDSQDTDHQRFRGYERLAGNVYKNITVAIRQYRNKNIAGKSKIDISPYQIWQTVMKDAALKIVEDINPIQNLKESEMVTYVGDGGRSTESMNKASRAYHVNDMGIVSEATVDSSDVGVNAYLSANPQFSSLRGLGKKEKVLTPASFMSTSALLAPASDTDDTKRVNFISIQRSHLIAAEGYRQPYVKTGYEYVIAGRTGDMFAYTAKQDGIVISKTENGIIVEYKDGTKKGVTLGRVYGKAEGSVYPHDIVSKLEVGKKFSKGDPIAYNTGFFEQDLLDPMRIVMKTSMTAKTALFESVQTHDDASSISKSFTSKLSAKSTKVKSFVVNFKQGLINVVKPGQAVAPNDYLMIIEDEITSTTDSFDQDSLEALKRLSNQAPKATYLGVVDRIEVLYHGDKDDMSASLRALADRSDKLLAAINKASNKPTYTGEVTDDYRVAGVPLALDKAEVKIYITVTNGFGVGDKTVFGNQLKSVCGEVMEYDMHTEEGEPIDAIFGYRGIAARIVLSALSVGTTITLLKVIGKKAVKLYKG